MGKKVKYNSKNRHANCFYPETAYQSNETISPMLKPTDKPTQQCNKNNEEVPDKESRNIQNEIVAQIILWKHPIYPGVIVCTISLLFLPFYMFRAPIIFGVTVIVLVCIFVEIVTNCFATFIKRSNQYKEKLDGSTKQLLEIWLSCCGIWEDIQSKKAEDPVRYYLAITIPLLGYSFISYHVNNWIVIYATVLTVISVPGLVNKGWLHLKHA